MPLTLSPSLTDYSVCVYVYTLNPSMRALTKQLHTITDSRWSLVSSSHIPGVEFNRAVGLKKEDALEKFSVRSSIFNSGGLSSSLGLLNSIGLVCT